MSAADCDFLTFFRNRWHDPGRAWRMEIDRPEGGCHLLFYSKSYLDQAAYLPAVPRARLGRYEPYKARLAGAIHEEGGGGLLVESALSGGRLRVEIAKISSAGTCAYLPPSALFLIDPCGEASECPIPGETLSLALPPGAWIVLPVDREAESAWRSFREHYAAWFPPDFETCMLNLLRRPSLELRVDALERRILGRSE